MAIVRNKALDRRQAEQEAVPRQSVGRLSEHEQNDTDHRTDLIETPSKYPNHPALRIP